MIATTIINSINVKPRANRYILPPRYQFMTSEQSSRYQSHKKQTPLEAGLACTSTYGIHH